MATHPDFTPQVVMDLQLELGYAMVTCPEFTSRIVMDPFFSAHHMVWLLAVFTKLAARICAVSVFFKR